MDYLINVEIWVSADSPEDAEGKLEAVLDSVRKDEGPVTAFQIEGPVGD